MGDEVGDARLRELKFLAKLARQPSMRLAGKFEDTTERQMIISLIADGHLNGLDTVADAYQGTTQSVRFVQEALELKAGEAKWKTINYLLGGQTAHISIGHRGLVRLSELEQALKADRQRDPTGVLFERRYLMPALEMNLTRVGPENPMTVAFLDVNDLKLINDSGSHSLGDEALKTCFSTIVAGIGPEAEAFRYGGDEIVVVLAEDLTPLLG